MPQDQEVLADVARWIGERLSGPPEVAPHRSHGPHDGRAALPELTAEGVGTAAAWETVRDEVLPTTFPTDHPRYLAFVGGAPTPAAVLADAALSAASVYGGSELEAGAVVAAERAAIGWLCSAMGYPSDAHGTFVSGGSLANLSALVAARHGRTSASGRPPGVVVAGASAHSSVRSAAETMGCEVAVAGTPDAVLRAADVEAVLAGLDPSDVVAVVASAGATNTGLVDALDEIADCCSSRRIWLHVDAAYGGAAMLAPARREAFAGIERADSVTIDPHKWLFTPFDCAAVVYREPAVARAAHRQSAHYLDAVEGDDADNPADYAVHLTRRARGLPLWASLLANGTDAYVDAVERCLATAGYAAKQVDTSPVLELAAEPRLSVVLLRRSGWGAADYAHWSSRARFSGLGLVTPTTYAGETVLRLCFVNPRTTQADVDMLLESLETLLDERTG
ncbi:pyridoxal phosphate-dependent decarboxylase family protein [Nocardioides terrae]|uniref:pyridoxal phosphate-dependent decarboxylase family protein n=1 Tax=Nocardioides terrae TaxID=574651 RepID=UPI001C3152A5|nr:pyridoxal-dependent decarboxylase [Nocardioides terrae]